MSDNTGAHIFFSTRFSKMKRTNLRHRRDNSEVFSTKKVAFLYFLSSDSEEDAIKNTVVVW